MINNFYSPVHYTSEPGIIANKRESLQLRNVRSVIFNRREGVSLLHYRDGSSLYVNNAVGLRVMAFLRIFKR